MITYKKCINILDDESCTKCKCLFGFGNRRCVFAGHDVSPGTRCDSFKLTSTATPVGVAEVDNLHVDASPRLPAADELRQPPTLNDVRAGLARVLLDHKGGSPSTIVVDQVPVDGVDELKTELVTLGYTVSVNADRMIVTWA